MLFPADAVLAQSASPVCATTAVPPLVRSEGLAERLGDIVMTCTGRPGQTVSGNLSVILNTNITNRPQNGRMNAPLTVDTGGGPSLLALPEALLPNQIVYSGITFSIGPGGSAELRVTNLRGDASRVAAGMESIRASLAFNPPSLLGFNSTQLVVGVPNRGLTASSLLTVVANQIGSPMPETLSFTGLLAAGTRFSSTRITEGFPGAFHPRGPTDDQGTRVVLRFSDFPTTARVFVPSIIIGANGERPTSAGDYGGTISGGTYRPGTLALALVTFPNADASGGNLSALSSTEIQDAAAEIPLSNGSGIAVFEVIDSNPAAIESAQIPVFMGLPREIQARTITTNRTVSLGPISSSTSTSLNQPVPRFAVVAPGNDCASLDDCLQYQPKLQASPANTNFLAVSGANFQYIWVPFENVGGGVMAWSARVEYGTGSDWVQVYPKSGYQGNTLRLEVHPMGLAVGKYQATVVIDAGPAGVARYPVTLEVKPLPVPTPTITSAVNAASFTGPLTRGALATIKGANLSGNNLSVTFDGKPARILYTSADQINLQVPADLTGPSTRVVVSVNGVVSAAFSADLASVSPGIFPSGILNQDNRPNSPETPAESPSILQIFATGLLPAEGGAQIEVKLNNAFYWGVDLPYAAAAPGLPGMQQVNFALPGALATGTADLSVCATAPGAQRVCSPPVRVHVRGQ